MKRIEKQVPSTVEYQYLCEYCLTPQNSEYAALLCENKHVCTHPEEKQIYDFVQCSIRDSGYGIKKYCPSCHKEELKGFDDSQLPGLFLELK